MIQIRIPAPHGFVEQLAIRDLAEQIAEGIPVEDPRWPGAYRAYEYARDAAAAIWRGQGVQPILWPQLEPVEPRFHPIEQMESGVWGHCSDCGHEHMNGEDCLDPDEPCNWDGCCIQ